jgi:hypothetical protein
MFKGYSAGGNIAGRMARFDGAKQGLAVFLWAIVVAIVALVAWSVGAEYNLLLDMNPFPRFPVDEGAWTTVSVVAALLWLVASPGAVVLGGLTGVRYHRKVDTAGYRGRRRRLRSEGRSEAVGGSIRGRAERGSPALARGTGRTAAGTCPSR